jgi:hypothetical protein
VLGEVVIECEQRFAILLETLGNLVVFDLVAFFGP